jgi:hypothetical protein
VIYIFPTSQYQFQPQKDQDYILTAQLIAFLSAEYHRPDIHSVTEAVLPPIQNVVGVC